MDIHTTVPAGKSGRVLRLADATAPGWQATLDGRALTRTTVDGWAQGFELPAQGGKLDVTYDEPLTHTLWVWAQVLLAVVLLVLALPGRRERIDDDLPEEELPVPAEPVAGEGRRARRLRAAAQAEAEAAGGTDGPDATAAMGTTAAAEDGPAGEPGEPGEQNPYAPAGDPAADPSASAADDGFAPQYGTEIPQQPAYGDWEQPAYATGDYSQYPAGQYGNEGHYANDGTYAPGQYGQDGYGGEAQYGNEAQYGDDGQGGSGRPGQPGPYPDGQQQYDPYQQQPDGQYDPYGYVQHPQQPPYPDENEHRPDGSNQ